VGHVNRGIIRIVDKVKVVVYDNQFLKSFI